MKEHIIYVSSIQCASKQECLSQVEKIQKTLTKRSVTPEDIIQLTDTGYSVQFAPIKKYWKSQSIFGVDIDNLTNTTLQKLIRQLTNGKLPPFAAFATLSNPDPDTPTRVRLYFALNEPVTDMDRMYHIIRLVYDTVATLSSKESIDYQSMNPQRLFFPGHLIYSVPKKKILLKNILPLADIAYAKNPIVINPIRFLEYISDSFDRIYGVPGTMFQHTNTTENDIIMAAPINNKGKPILQFSRLENGPLYQTIIPLSIKENGTSFNPYKDNIERGDNRRIYKISGNSKGFKSTEAPLSLAKVNILYQSLFADILLDKLNQAYDTPIFDKKEILKNKKNLETLFQAFHIETYSVTKTDLTNNIQRYLEFFQTDFSNEYPKLYRIISMKGRLEKLILILRKAIQQTSMLTREQLRYMPQHIIPIEEIVLQITNGKSKSLCNSTRDLYRLFDMIGILSIIPLEKQSYSIRQIWTDRHTYRTIPTVLSIPWFDEILLHNLEQRADTFLKEDKTIKGIKKVDTEHNETYLALYQCVISLLDTKPYFTRTDLVKLVEAEGLCQTGKKGDHIVNRYLPAAAKELKLVKSNFTKHLESRLPKPDPSLTYGASIIYHREDLLHADIAS